MNFLIMINHLYILYIIYIHELYIYAFFNTVPVNIDENIIIALINKYDIANDILASWPNIIPVNNTATVHYIYYIKLQ